MPDIPRFNLEYKDRANELLRLANQGLYGEGIEQPFKGAVADALSIRDQLRDDMGAVWQADRLTEMIKRAIKKGDFLERQPRSSPSLCSRHDLRPKPAKAAHRSEADGGVSLQ